WGEGMEATPVRIVKAWMKSPGHRENILRPEFTEVGVGVAYDAPIAGPVSPVGVYTTDFGGM
ncbi:MAG TPA: CAP domain-containing protein, partial [Thermoleophilaceae bacterium]|nr:CAP domain-containing protein [Thermoleophilaceae bacterium]